MSGLFEHRRFAFAVVLAVLALSAPAAALAQTGSQDVPVVVMGVDSRTLPRTHELSQRVIAGIKGIMSDAGSVSSVKGRWHRSSDGRSTNG